MTLGSGQVEHSAAQSPRADPFLPLRLHALCCEPGFHLYITVVHGIDASHEIQRRLSDLVRLLLASGAALINDDHRWSLLTVSPKSRSTYACFVESHWSPVDTQRVCTGWPLDFVL